MAFAAPVRVNHVGVELISDVASIQPGGRFQVGLRMRLDKNWHTYWRNPGGNVGLPITITWKLPDGYEAGPVQWPYPTMIVDKILDDEPPLISYAYENEVILLTEISAPVNIASGAAVSIAANVKWLACETACIPGSADLTLSLPVDDGKPSADERWTAEFAETRKRLPVATMNWQLDAALNDNILELRLEPLGDSSPSLSKIRFFPYMSGVIIDWAPQQLIRSSGHYLLTIQLDDTEVVPARLQGILVSDDGWDAAGTLNALRVDTPIISKAVTDSAPSLTDVPQGTSLTLLVAIGFAFVGGLILNLMPCVFPVLSLKVLNFVKKAGEDKRVVRLHGLVFTTGVLVTFWVLSGVLIGLRAGGDSFGWGFQLQSPGFLVILVSFLFLFALNLFDVFEIGTSFTTIGGNASLKAGYSGSFFTGVFAVIVATPCTAPFMGTAMGFALAQPAATALLIFTSLGIGLAFPYLLLSFFPDLLRYLPRPGPWMSSFKQFMGLLIMATIAWLLWVFGGLAGNDALGNLLFSLVFLAAGTWVYGSWIAPKGFRKAKIASVIASLFFISIGVSFGVRGATGSGKSVGSEASALGEDAEWMIFSPDALAQLRKNGKPVFIDFTADWCLTCKVNERVAFTPKVMDAFRERGITLMIADYTRRSEEITEALAGFGRTGVPLYVLYPGGSGGQPQILPQLLTAGTVLKAIDNL